MKVKAINTVFETDDYTIFKRMEYNRDVIEQRVSKILRSISERDIAVPIVCNEKMEIVDGQGRYEARKRLGLPIPYIIIPGLTIDDCRRMNSTNPMWKPQDYAESFARQGNNAYILLLEASEKLKCGLNRVLELSGKGEVSKTKKGEKIPAFYDGKLDFNARDVERAERVKKHADDIRDALCFSARPNGQFYRAIGIILDYPGYKTERMLERCKEERATFAQASHLEGMLKEFERIYNKKINRTSKNYLYFSDYMRNKGYNVRSYDNSNFRTKYYRHDREDVSTLEK